MTKLIPARIVVETFPNLQFRSFHTTVRISNCSHYHLTSPEHDYSAGYIEKVGSFGVELVHDSSSEKVGLLGVELVRKVFEIPGINEVAIKPYELSLQIGKAFLWEDTEDDVLALVKECFGDRKNEVEVSRYPDSHSPRA